MKPYKTLSITHQYLMLGCLSSHLWIGGSCFNSHITVSLQIFHGKNQRSQIVYLGQISFENFSKCNALRTIVINQSTDFLQRKVFCKPTSDM